MNTVTVFSTPGQPVTMMTTREVAGLVQKQHGNIKISAERLSEKGIIGTLAVQEFTHNGNTYTEYLLNKRDSLVLVAQNCPEFTAKIVDRWQELENQASGNQFNVPTTFAGALRLALEQAELIEQQTALIAQQAPAVAYVEKFVKADGLIGVREAAKSLGLNQNAFVSMMIDAKLMFRENGHLQAYAPDIDAGRFVVQAGTDSTGKARASTKFTAKGLRWVASKLRLDQLFQD
jgi:phage antirepressor YoqD-like protein